MYEIPIEKKILANQNKKKIRKTTKKSYRDNFLSRRRLEKQEKRRLQQKKEIKKTKPIDVAPDWFARK